MASLRCDLWLVDVSPFQFAVAIVPQTLAWFGIGEGNHIQRPDLSNIFGRQRSQYFDGRFAVLSAGDPPVIVGARIVCGGNIRVVVDVNAILVIVRLSPHCRYR